MGFFEGFKELFWLSHYLIGWKSERENDENIKEKDTKSFPQRVPIVGTKKIGSPQKIKLSTMFNFA